MKGRRDEVAREGLALVAIVAHVAIEEAPCGLDAVFGGDEFLLEVEEVLVGLQLGVSLDRDE